LNANCTYVSIQFVYVISTKNRGRHSNHRQGRITAAFDPRPRRAVDVRVRFG